MGDITINNCMRFNQLFEHYMNSNKQIVGIPTTRQQRGYTGGQRLHQNLIPDRDRHDASLNQKIEILRDKPRGKEYITAKDLEYIIPKYNLANLTKTSPKFLGKTGIKIYWDEQVGEFCLEK